MKNIQLMGIFPRSHDLIYKTWDYEKGRKTKKELEKDIAQESKSIINLQKDFEYKTDGLLFYQDLFRPFVENVKGIKPGALTRWFDNNIFFRQPIICGDITNSKPFLYKYICDGANKAILPGPLAFFSSCLNKTSDEDRNILCYISEMIAREAKDLEERGISFIQFNEPSLEYNYKFKQVSKVYNIIIDSLSKSKTCIHTYFGDVSKILSYLLELKVDCIGMDFYATNLKDLLSVDFNKELLCGCIDSRNSLIEDINLTKELIKSVKSSLNPKSITICPNCDLEFVPSYIAEKKIDVLRSC